MARGRKVTDWVAARADYVQNQMQTLHSIAAKYGTSPKTVEWHALREGWTDERKNYSEKVRQKLGDQSSSNAAEALVEVHKQHLSATKELRQMIASKLKSKNSDGQVVLRPDVSLSDLARVAQAYFTLLEGDRLALGADQLPVHDARTPEAELSDQELFARLQNALKRHPVASVQ